MKKDIHFGPGQIWGIRKSSNRIDGRILGNRRSEVGGRMISVYIGSYLWKEVTISF